MNDPTAVDLFCGCGGMSLGAARAGFLVLAGVDKDARAIAAHSSNFPEAKHINLDLSRINASEILPGKKGKPKTIDVLMGGPPCQGFSTIGRRDLFDPRNLLISQFSRLVNEFLPRAFVLENVPGILSDAYSATLAAAINRISKSYDIMEPKGLAAIDAGAPTLRKRVFIIGFRKPVHLPSDFWTHAIDRSTVPVVKQALDGLPVDILPNWKTSRGGKRTVRTDRVGEFFAAASGRIPRGVGDSKALEEYQSKAVVTGCIGTLHSKALEQRYAALAYGESDPKTKSVKLDPEGYCPTLRAGTGPDRGSFQAVRPIHYLRPRVITPREAARLQGFPDWYQFDETKWHSFRQIGNSVSPLVAEFVLQRVRKVLEDA
jgi:DNA (cytosine-5)-methyltransferase 1